MTDQTSPSDGAIQPETEYTDEQYEEYLRYQQRNEGAVRDVPEDAVSFPSPTSVPGPSVAAGANGPSVAPNFSAPRVDSRGADVVEGVANDRVEGAKDTAAAARDTAAAMFGEVKSAVSVASKREPYAFLALASAAFVTVWLVWPEDDKIGAQRLKLWTVFVLASVALLFTPIVKKIVRLDAARAWQFAAGGASGLGFAWVAFLLPDISSNQSFFGTLAVAAGALAAWTAPGRPE
jgi:hypothetical protein